MNRALIFLVGVVVPIILISRSAWQRHPCHHLVAKSIPFQIVNLPVLRVQLVQRDQLGQPVHQDQLEHLDQQLQLRPDLLPKLFRATEGCGGVLEGNSGQIGYTIGNVRLPNGIVCVWTIRAPGSGRLLVSLDADTFANDGDNSYISIFSVGQDAVLEKSHKILSGDRATYEIEGQVAYVIFRASAGAGREAQVGFQLYFRGDLTTVDESLWTGGNKSHVHFHFNRAQGAAEEFEYPSNPRRPYSPDEFGSWVLNPEHPKMINRLTLYYLDFEDFTCSDFINIHQVDGDEPKLLAKRCNTNTYFSSSFKYDTVREPFIITFNSNWKSQRTGFILFYSNDRDRWDQNQEQLSSSLHRHE